MELMHTQKLMNKPPKSKAMCILLSCIMTLSCASGLVAAIPYDSEAYADDGYQDITFSVSGEGSIVLTTADEELAVENDAVSLSLPIGTYVHMEFASDEDAYVSVLDENGNNIEDSSVDEAGEFRDVTVTESNKTVEVIFGEVSSSSIITLDATADGDDISVGDVYTGTCEVTYVSGGNGHTVDSVRISNFTGFLSDDGTFTVYCADHGAAAPYAGQDFTYRFTVTSIDTDTGKVSGTLYCSAVYGSATDESINWDSNKGYQRLENTVTVSRDFVTTGYLSITKSSSNTNMSSGNSCYSLAGAVFTVYDSSGGKVATLTTNSSGKTASLELDAETYTVKETTAPAGYAISSSTWKITIESDETTTLTVSDVPQNNPIDLLLQKTDSKLCEAQGAATFAGAEYVVEYYDGYYSTASAARASGNATRTWVFATDEDGYIYLSSDYLIRSTSDGAITSNSLYYNSTGGETLPLGTYVMYEYTAPVGYVLSDETYVTQVTSEGTSETVKTYNAPTEEAALTEEVIRGGVEIYKRDIESDLTTGLGAASMEKTQFEITSLNKNDVVVDGITYSYGDVVATLTIEDGYASTSDNLLPYGTYSIQEVYSGEGYLLNDIAYEFTIDEDGEIVTAGTSDGHIHNQVKRSDFELTKKASNGSTSLAGVAFKITSTTTGESHVIVTDENGYFSSASSWNAHSSNTNGNDWVLDMSGTIDSSQLDATAGIWFGLTTEGNTVEVDDSLGALPYDTYLIEELRCSSNEGYQLISTTVTISRDSAVVNLGTLDDPEAEISTTATDALDGDNYVGVGEVTITDKVSYSHLVAGSTYTLTGQLYDAETGEALEIDDEPVIASTTFIAEKSYGSINVEFTLGTWNLAGKTLVVYETLSDAHGSIVAEHKDQSDIDQQVTVLTPQIETHATDGIDEDKNIVADAESVIVDTITYSDLTPGETYTITGTLMIRSYDEDGNAVEEELRVGTGQKSYEVYDEATDTWITYESIDSSSNSYYTFTVNENGSLSVYHVTTGGSYDEESDSAKSFITMLPAGDFAEGMWREAELTTPVTSNMTFTPETSSGEIEVTFTFDSTALPEDTEVVVFESLYLDGVEIAVHADINDENQTVYVVVPDIATTATDGLDNDKTVIADRETTITDTITYSDLISGQEYSLAGILMDADTGFPILSDDADYTEEELMAFMETLSSALGLTENEDGTITLPANIDADALESVLDEYAKLVDCLVIQTTSFTPDDYSGSVSMDFEFDSNDVIDRLSGETKNIVVFEVLFKGTLDDDAENEPVIVAIEADLENEDQTVTLTPSSLGTTATDATDGDHELLPSTNAVITDLVKYTGLIPGQEYILCSMLYDKSTGESLLVNDETVTAELRFTPNSEDGSVSIDLEFDASELEGYDLVVFEELYKQSTVDGDTEEVLVAEHKDIDDENQTVSVAASPEDTTTQSNTGSTYDKTGGDNTLILITILTLLLLTALCAGYYIHRRHVLASQRALRKARAFETMSFP